jgi:replicative DNA helicase
VVCFIHRPEYYHITTDKDGNSLVGIAEIIVAKHRNGATDTVHLKFKNEFAKFLNLDDIDADDVFNENYQVISSKMNVPENSIYENTTGSPALDNLLKNNNNEVPF